MQKRPMRVSGIALVSLLFVICMLYVPVQAKTTRPEFRNVIVFVGDGMGSAHTTLARWYKGSPLSFDRMYTGGIRTYGADSLITDSAPAATAFACGHKSGDKFIGIMPDRVTIPGVPQPGPLRFKPVASVLEGARLSGRSVGLVATSIIQHATPAAYSSHWPDRGNYNEIARQQVYQNIDVVLGGGKRYLLPKGKGGARTDNEDLMDTLRSKGYTLAGNREELLKVTSGKVWGMFADSAMAYEFDRKHVAPDEPSLAEMTGKAIEILSKNRKGFFLFVEGSKIDWASHANDPIGVISDVLALEEAVAVALDFAGKKGQTLVIALSDHGNGGMSIGSKKSGKVISHQLYEALLTPLKKASLTGEGVERSLKGNRSEGNVKKIVAKYFGVDDLTPDEVREIQDSKPARMNSALGPIMSRRSHIGWTTNGHTGEDVFFYYYGISKPLRLMENSDIGRMVAKGMGFDLAEVDRRLYVAADEAFKAAGASVFIDDKDPGNKVLIIESAGKRAELPFSKNVMRVKTSVESNYTLEGITVFSPGTGAVYVPEQAITIFSKEGRSDRRLGIGKE